MKISSGLILIIFLVLITSCTLNLPTLRPSSTPAEDQGELQVSVTGQAPTPEYSTISNLELKSIPWDDRSIFSENLVSDEQPILNELEGKTVYHIELFIPEDIISLSGHQEVLYTNLEEESLEEIYFRLYPNLFTAKVSISSVTIGGTDVVPNFELYNSAARLPLTTPLQSGEEVLIAMDFTIEVPTEGSGNYGLFGYIDEILVLHKFYPVIPAYDDEGWNVEIPPPHGDVSYFDASFYIVQVTAPEKLILAASGEEINRRTKGDQQIVTFADGPARGFYLAASNHFSVMSATLGETEVNSYHLPGLEDGAEAALEIAVDAIDSFNQRFGIYPYTEMDLVSTPMQALGMEYPGITAISKELYNLNGQIGDVPTSIYLESAVAHEVGHMWFYNMVGNDQVDEPWVDEAIVQYITGLYYQDVYGSEAYEGFKDSWIDRWSRIEFADIPIGLATADYDGREYSSIVYGRGPLFIDALAQEMGEEVFNSFLRDYFETNKWEIGTAKSFRELAESHCSCDLTALFEEWVY